MPNGRLSNNRTSNAALYRGLRAAPGAAYFPANPQLTEEERAPVQRFVTETLPRAVPTAPFTWAPDLVGLAQQGYGYLEDRFADAVEGRLGFRPMQSPLRSAPIMSGNPLREQVGLDPADPGTMVAEMLDPSAALAKGVTGFSKLLANYGPEVAKGFSNIIDPAWAMTLFHGTPHKFNQFRLADDTIGTGEGQQAFGHGLYFAENPGVAGSYATNLGQFDRVGINSLDIAPMPNTKVSESAHMNLDEYFDLTQGEGLTQARYDDAIADMQKRVDEFGENSLLSQSDVDELKGLSAKDFRPARGHLYEVEIPDEITDRMLDWDAPLSEQPTTKAAIEGALGRSIPDDLTGEEAYMALAGSRGDSQFISSMPGSQEKASDFLRELGIPGIRYYDGSSRAAGEGTRNIVVFNPDDITQVKRDGELVWENKSGVRPQEGGRLAD